MLEKYGFAVFLSISIIFSPPSYAAKYVNLEDYVAPTKRAIKIIRKNWTPYLTASQQQLDQSIVYKVPLTWNSNGWAQINDDGKREIAVSAGEAFLLSALSQAYIYLGLRKIDKRCFESYLIHINDALVGNSRQPGSSPMMEPLAFFYENRSICPAFAFDIPQGKWNYIYENMMLGSLEVLLAHELGHHVYGDVMREGASKSTSRQQEARADNFAIQLVVKQNPELILQALPLYTMLSLGSPTSSAGEVGRTHPAGLRRLRSALDAIETSLKDPNNELRKYMIRTNQWDSFNQTISQFRKQTSGLD